MYLFHIQGRTTCKIYNRYLGQKIKKEEKKNPIKEIEHLGWC